MHLRGSISRRLDLSRPICNVRAVPRLGERVGERGRERKRESILGTRYSILACDTAMMLVSSVANNTSLSQHALSYY